MIGGNEQMYCCLECGAIFENPDYWEEQHGLDYGPFEKWSGCPHCKGAYTKAHECSVCGHYINGEYIKLVSGERICENCYATYELGEEE